MNEYYTALIVCFQSKYKISYEKFKAQSVNHSGRLGSIVNSAFSVCGVVTESLLHIEFQRYYIIYNIDGNIMIHVSQIKVFAFTYQTSPYDINIRRAAC